MDAENLIMRRNEKIFPGTLAFISWMTSGWDAKETKTNSKNTKKKKKIFLCDIPPSVNLSRKFELFDPRKIQTGGDFGLGKKKRRKTNLYYRRKQKKKKLAQRKKF